MKHFYPDGGGHEPDGNVPMHRTWGLNEWSDGNYVNHMPWPSQSPDLGPN